MKHFILLLYDNIFLFFTVATPIFLVQKTCQYSIIARATYDLVGHPQVIDNELRHYWMFTTEVSGGSSRSNFR